MKIAPDLNGLRAETVVRREGVRRVARRDGYNDAARACGPITPGCEIFGFTKGQFSFIDLIAHVLVQIGPADVVISTWTAAFADTQAAYMFLEDGRLRSLRWIVDRSFASRQPEYCAALVERFGEDAIRVTRTHAKFALIENGGFRIVIRTSMNLNTNPRFENFEVSDCAVLADMVRSVVDEIWASGHSVHATTSEVDGAFAEF